jgi:hypothetical protein
VKPNTWEFVRNADGSFAILHRGEKRSDNIPARWLEAECGKFGFCGQEFRKIREALTNSDKHTITLGVT